MTIYSAHPSRGKIQILATYYTPAGTVSATVSSVEDSPVAAGVTDALNRISACATVPLTMFDMRGEGVGHYPTDHLDHIVDPALRDRLLVGAHSLWFENAKILLHEALVDLDAALEGCAPPVRLAILAELEVEVRDLKATHLMFSANIEPEVEIQREWEHELPFVSFQGAASALTGRRRAEMDRAERKFPDLAGAVDGLRLLYEAVRLSKSRTARLDDCYIHLTDDPDDYSAGGHFLSIEAPTHPRRDEWHVALYRWEPDDDDEDGNSSHSDLVVDCALDTPPTARVLANLLDLSNGDDGRLASWAATPVGQPLEGTSFLVTERADRR
ncbi:hypothetical protein R8Z50_11020 [Longispora sp. K20-0274]|uniref:hypothetical protein n=1 Tax=Longispora sp. K20-0274 TaxID=3088255 RepID=UPI00399C4398